MRRIHSIPTFRSTCNVTEHQICGLQVRWWEKKRSQQLDTLANMQNENGELRTFQSAKSHRIAFPFFVEHFVIFLHRRVVDIKCLVICIDCEEYHRISLWIQLCRQSVHFSKSVVTLSFVSFAFRYIAFSFSVVAVKLAFYSRGGTSLSKKGREQSKMDD